MICFLALMSTLGQAPSQTPAPNPKTPPATAPQVLGRQGPLPGRPQPPLTTPPVIPAETPVPSPDKVAMTVNGHNILVKQVQDYLWQWNAGQVEQTLVIMELIKQEANKEHVTVSDAEIKKDMQEQLTALMQRAPRGTTPEQALKGRNVSVSQLAFNSRAKLLMQKIAINSLKPSDFVRVSVLMVRPKSQAQPDMQDALKKASDAYDALQKGDPWEKVFSTYSSDTQSAPNQGEVGWTALIGFPPSTKAELGTLKLNGYTKPFQTPQGIEIFKLENRGEAASPGELDPVKLRYVPTKEREIIENLRKTAVIKTNY